MCRFRAISSKQLLHACVLSAGDLTYNSTQHKLSFEHAVRERDIEVYTLPCMQKLHCLVYAHRCIMHAACKTQDGMHA